MGSSKGKEGKNNLEVNDEKVKGRDLSYISPAAFRSFL
jgi:hypothetical protein